MSRNLPNEMRIKPNFPKPIENYRKMTIKHQANNDSMILQNDAFRV